AWIHQDGAWTSGSEYAIYGTALVQPTSAQGSDPIVLGANAYTVDVAAAEDGFAAVWASPSDASDLTKNSRLSLARFDQSGASRTTFVIDEGQLARYCLAQVGASDASWLVVYGADHTNVRAVTHDGTVSAAVGVDMGWMSSLAGARPTSRPVWNGKEFGLV